MKTNAVKTVLVAVAISFALTSCENDTLNELETKKVNIEQIKPIDNHNDRELERNLIKELPIRKEKKTMVTTSSNQKENNDRLIQKDNKKQQLQFL